MGLKWSQCCLPQPVVPLVSVWTLYKPEEGVGKGSYGSVFSAVLRNQTKTQKKVALKLLPKNKATSAICYRNEVEILKELYGIPHMVNILDSFTDDDNYVIVSELLTKRDLCDEIIDEQGFSEEKAGIVFVQLLEAMRELHSRDIAHLDVKPENCVFSEAGELKLVDFGSAIRIRTLDVNTKYFRGRAGTAHYCAPEFLVDRPSIEKELLKACDMWSLGILLYVMITAAIPFSGKSLSVIRNKCISGRLYFPSKIMPSNEIMDLLQQLLKPVAYQRITVEDALRHPWVRQFSSILPKKSSPKIPVARHSLGSSVLREARVDLMSGPYAFSKSYEQSSYHSYDDERMELDILSPTSLLSGKFKPLSGRKDEAKSLHKLQEFIEFEGQMIPRPIEDIQYPIMET